MKEALMHELKWEDIKQFIGTWYLNISDFSEN